MSSLGEAQLFLNFNRVFDTFNQFTGNEFNEQPQANQQYYPTQLQNNLYSSSQNCEGIFSYEQDQNGVFGLITISNPDPFRNILKVELSLAAQLSNVRRIFFDS